MEHPQIKPDDIGYLTDLDSDYFQELKAVMSGNAFESLLHKYEYWLDEETKNLNCDDWERLAPRIAELRKGSRKKNNFDPESLAVALPARLLEVTLLASQFGVPWGTMYIRLREEKQINF